jgi:Tol biopolymer transport system component
VLTRRPALATSWLFLGLASIISPLGCGENGAEAGRSDAAGRIVFTVNRSGFGEIWVMDPDGGDPARLTDAGSSGIDASGSTSPAWSPDGGEIAFASSGDAVVENHGDVEIYVMDATGDARRRLTNDDVYDATPAWSADGRRLVFAHLPGLGTEDADGVIVVMDADGTGRVDLTHHSRAPGIVLDADPAWSPDGRLIAFTRATFASDGEPHVAIYAITPDGGGERLLVDDAYEPAWSPDGRRIAFTSIRDQNGKTCFEECSPNGEIYTAEADGTDLRRLTESPADDRSPTWSPDGRHIAFTSDRSSPAEHENEIYVIDSAGGDLRRVTANDVWDLEPDWSGTLAGS